MSTLTIVPGSEVERVLGIHDVPSDGEFEVLDAHDLMDQWGSDYWGPDTHEHLHNIENQGGVFAFLPGDPVMEENGPIPVYPGEYELAA